ncbi:MAG: hypothetical protein Q9159_001224 [Coniocarpon cinnabarinum]
MSGSPNPATAGRLETGANSSEAQKTPNRLSVWNASPSPVGSDRVLYEERDRRPKSKSNASSRLWAWEIVSAVFSLCCIAAIVGVLLYENGKELSSWKLKIAPNAVVSFLGTIGKSATLLAVTEVISQLKWLHFQEHPQKLSDLTMFDEASRGPGAFKLSIFKHKNTLLATLAALVMLASLIVDPAIQLVFEFPERLSLKANAQPGIQTSSYYVTNSTGYNGPGMGRNPNVGQAQNVDPTMQAAIVGGFSTNTSYSLECPNEQCEWDSVWMPTSCFETVLPMINCIIQITTLGFCGSCEDVTGQVQSTCSWKNSTEYQSSQSYCQYDFGPTQVNSSYIQGGDWSFVAWNSSTGRLFQKYTGPAYGEPQVPATEVNLAVFVAVKQATSQNWTYPPSQQMFCGIKMCAKTYEHAVFRNGTKIFSAPVETMLNFSVTNTSLNQEGTMHFIPSNTDHPLGNDTDFSMNMNDFANLATYLAQLFGVSWSQGTDTGGQYFRNNDPDVTGTSFDDATPMVAEYLANHPDTDALMRNIGEAMTEVVRTSGNKTLLPGRAYQTTTFIHVQWGWLALPITLMVLTILLLIIVIIQTHKKRAVVWKSSSLALLFHKLDGWDIPEGSITDRHKLQDVAILKPLGSNLYSVRLPTLPSSAASSEIPTSLPSPPQSQSTSPVAHPESSAETNRDILVELPKKLRNTLFIRRGGFVLVDCKAFDARENKLGGEIVGVVGDVREWRKCEWWPKEFGVSEARKDCQEGENEDVELYGRGTVGELPGSGSEEENELG